MYIPYVTLEEYEEFKGNIPNDLVTKYLRQASRHIDTLTYNRIVSRGIDNLTDFQREIIKETVCMQADFEYNNREIFDMILQGYSINGVSMNFGESWNVFIQNGIPIQRDVYAYLSQTGLTSRRL